VEETTENGKFKLTQNRYLAAGNVKPNENEILWPLLIGVSSQSCPAAKFIDFNTRSAVVTVDVKTENEWVKFNAGQTGLFRVRYSAPILRRLGTNLPSLSPEDRAGIQNDTFALAISGDLLLTEYLHLLSYYQNETNDTVWTDIFTNLSTIRRLFGDSTCKHQLDTFVLQVCKKFGEDLGWSGAVGEDESQQSLRGSVLSVMGSCGDKAVIEEANKRWHSFLKDNDSLSGDLQGCVFGLAVFAGGEEELNQMINVYKTSVLPAQKITALRCIGGTRNPDLVNKGLEYMMSDDVRMQDRFILLHSLCSTPIGRQICWDYVKQHWNAITEKFSANLAPRVITETCEDFSTLEMARDFEAFFAVHKAENMERTIAQTLECIHSNADILHRNEKPMIEFMNLHIK